MNFCPECNFMVYTRLNENGNLLTNYCKNCNWEGEYLGKNSDSSICVFKKNYSNDYLAEHAYTNKYTIYDPTLPRVSNIPCINEKCLTNQTYNELKTLHLFNVDSNHLMSEYNYKLKDFYEKKGLSIDKYTNIEVNDSEIISLFNEDIDVLSLFTDLPNENVEELGQNVIINQYIKPSREIIFIKYDENNMKYLYLCSTCLTSWKNE